MNDGLKKRVIKEIKVDTNKCTGCRSCEMACSAFHSIPKYSSLNPAKSRIRVYMDEIRDQYVPMRAGRYTQAECNGRNRYVINGKEYFECAFCSASCPSRDYFKDPDSGLPLRCDMCEEMPPIDEPMCVQACKFNALTYCEREEAYDHVNGLEEMNPSDIKVSFDVLIKKFGKKKVMQAISQLAQRSRNEKQSF